MTDEPDEYYDCFESNKEVLSVIYDIQGNSLTYGKIVDMLNDRYERIVRQGTSDDRCEDPILLIREACSRAMIGYVISELRTELIEEIVTELPDFFRQPLRADHEEKDTTSEESTG